MTEHQAVKLTERQHARREQKRREEERLARSAEFAVFCVKHDFTSTLYKVCAYLTGDKLSNDALADWFCLHPEIRITGDQAMQARERFDLADHFPSKDFPSYHYDYVRDSCDELAKVFHRFGINISPVMELKAAIRYWDDACRASSDFGINTSEAGQPFMDRITANQDFLEQCFDELAIKVGDAEVAPPEPHNPIDVEDRYFEHYLHELLKLATEPPSTIETEPVQEVSHTEKFKRKFKDLNLSQYDRWAIYWYLIEPQLFGVKRTETQVAKMVEDAARAQPNSEQISYKQWTVNRRLRNVRPLLDAMGIELFTRELKPMEFPDIVRVSPAILDMGPRSDGLTARQRDKHEDDEF